MKQCPFLVVLVFNLVPLQNIKHYLDDNNKV